MEDEIAVRDELDIDPIVEKLEEKLIDLEEQLENKDKQESSKDDNYRNRRFPENSEKIFCTNKKECTQESEHDKEKNDKKQKNKNNDKTVSRPNQEVVNEPIQDDDLFVCWNCISLGFLALVLLLVIFIIIIVWKIDKNRMLDINV
jgi:hypothetical protein